MPFTSLSCLGTETPARILLLHAGAEVGGGAGHSLTLAGLIQPLRMAARALGPGRLLAELRDAGQTPPAALEHWHLVLLVADEDARQPEQWRQMVARCRQAPFWGAVGTAVLWLARDGALRGVRTALPWALYPEVDEVADQAILTPNLFEIDGCHITCCGGAASMDFALGLIGGLYGVTLQSQIQEALCLDRIRDPSERQRVALQARFGASQPKLTEAVTLMEANIEEPLSTDDIANLVGVSRRQLERLFKQHLGSLPSRYYLELRLRRARQLLQESKHSIVQIGLMCGFSSASHFSTAFGTLFGTTPREERQRKMHPPPGNAAPAIDR